MIIVATKSILKYITVKEKATSRSLINALEHADKKTSIDVEFSRGVRTADRDLIQQLFKKKDDKDIH